VGPIKVSLRRIDWLNLGRELLFLLSKENKNLAIAVGKKANNVAQVGGEIRFFEITTS